MLFLDETLLHSLTFFMCERLILTENQLFFFFAIPNTSHGWWGPEMATYYKS